MLIRLKNSDIEHLGEYIEKIGLDCFHIISIYENLLKGINLGDFYIYKEESEVLGVFHFSETKVLSVHYTDDKVVKSLSLLKLIKSYKPRYIKAKSDKASGIYSLIIRNLSSYKEDRCIIMVSNSNLKLNAEKIVESEEITYLAMWDDKLRHSINLVTEAEKHFDIKIRNINSMMDNVKRQMESRNYVFALCNNRCVGQGIIEQETKEFCLIGGLYVSNNYRQMGIGFNITKKILDEIITRKKEAVLIVKRNNLPAINIYRKLGFTENVDYTIMTIEF